MNYIIRNTNKIASLGLIATMLAILAGPLAQVAQAAALTSLSDTMSTVKINTLANHDIQFTSPTGVASGQTVILTFQSDFSIPAALDFTDIDVLDDGVNVTLAAAPSGATWGSVRTSATVITLTNGTAAVAAGSVIRIKIGTNATNQSTGVRQITNPTTATTFSITMSGTFGDTGTISITTITNDAVAVSGTVNQTLSFSISANTIAFGTLDSAVARFANTTTGSATEVEAHTLIASTNSGSGYTITAQGATLTSGANTITAIGGTNTASSVGTEQFGLRATATGGSGTVTSPYAAAGFAYAGTASVASQIASAAGASAATTYSIRYLANIAAATESGSYTATLTYVATGNF